MTTIEEAIPYLEGEPNVDTMAMLVKCLADPLVRIWPEVDGHEHAVVAVSAQLGEVLEICCATGDGNFNALLALDSMFTALDQLKVSVGDSEAVATAKRKGQKIGKTLRAKYVAHEDAEVGDVLGYAWINGNKIPITKLEKLPDA